MFAKDDAPTEMEQKAAKHAKKEERKAQKSAVLPVPKKNVRKRR